MTSHLLTPSQIHEQFPLTLHQTRFIESTRTTLKNILERKDNRLVIITGPCSIHDVDSALEYGQRISELSKTVSDTCLLMMRVYVEKPRTRTGWTGILHDPHLDQSYDFNTGLQKTRELFLKLTEMEVPIATELLHPLSYPYLSDCISWGCIGARTVTSQPHRQLASFAPFPIGFKNSVDGNTDVAIDAVLCARESHTFFGADEHGRIIRKTSQGNPHSHIILRGSNRESNYDLCSLRTVQDKLDLNCRLMIDCSHGNCQKDEEKQKEVFFQTLENIEDRHVDVMGLMLESHLESGNQLLPLSPNRSITDPCIDWDATSRLILWAHTTLEMTPCATSSSY